MTALVCLPIIVAAFFVTNSGSSTGELRSSRLGRELKSSKDTSAQKLRLENETLNKKLDYFKNLPMESDISVILAMIPNLLPEGVWVDQIDIVYPEVLSSARNQQANRRSISRGMRIPAIPVINSSWSMICWRTLRAIKSFPLFWAAWILKPFRPNLMENIQRRFFHLKCR